MHHTHTPAPSPEHHDRHHSTYTTTTTAPTPPPPPALPPPQHHHHHHVIDIEIDPPPSHRHSMVSLLYVFVCMPPRPPPFRHPSSWLRRRLVCRCRSLHVACCPRQISPLPIPPRALVVCLHPPFQSFSKVHVVVQRYECSCSPSVRNTHSEALPWHTWSCLICNSTSDTVLSFWSSVLLPSPSLPSIFSSLQSLGSLAISRARASV